MMQEPALMMFKILTDVLDDEIKVYRNMLELVRREKEVLISAQIVELEDLNKAKEIMVLKIRALERQREKAAREMGFAVGLQLENPRLLEIATKLVDPQASKIRSIHSTLTLLISRIKEINDANEKLVQASLKMVSGALGAIKQTLQPKATYASSGEVKRTEVAGHFVSKEI